MRKVVWNDSAKTYLYTLIKIDWQWEFLRNKEDLMELLLLKVLYFYVNIRLSREEIYIHNKTTFFVWATKKKKNHWWRKWDFLLWMSSNDVSIIQPSKRYEEWIQSTVSTELLDTFLLGSKLCSWFFSLMVDGLVTQVDYVQCRYELGKFLKLQDSRWKKVNDKIQTCIVSQQVYTLFYCLVPRTYIYLSYSYIKCILVQDTLSQMHHIPNCCYVYNHYQI